MKILPIILLIVLAGCCYQKAGTRKASNSKDVISFNTNLPTGILGKQLGERMVITGRLTKLLPDQWRFMISVGAINGAPLQKPLEIELSGIPLQDGLIYEFEGFESGRFEGSPSWNTRYPRQPPPMHFQYWPHFVVTDLLRVEGQTNLTNASQRNGF